MKVPEDRPVTARVGPLVRKQCGGRLWFFWGHKRREQLLWTFGKSKWEVFLDLCLLLKEAWAFEQLVCWMSVGFSKWNATKLSLNIVERNGSKFNYTLQAAWQFPLCNAQFNKTAPNRPGNLVHTGVSVTRQKEGPSTRGPLNYSIMVTHTCRKVDTWDRESSSSRQLANTAFLW